MKTYQGSAYNILFLFDQESLAAHPAVELVLFLSEPVWKRDGDDMKKHHETTTQRLLISPEGILTLLKTLVTAHETVRGISITVDTEGQEEGERG